MGTNELYWERLFDMSEEEYQLLRSEQAHDDEQAELAYEAMISKERADALLVALRGHMEICGPLCSEHGDPRDTNIDIGRE
jgi:hypothetical protein